MAAAALRVIAFCVLLLGVASVRSPSAEWEQQNAPFEQYKARRMAVTLGLRQQGLEQLEELFWTVSNPKHERYQQFLTPEQIRELVEPPAEEQARVIDWLVSSGVQREHIDNRGDSLFVCARAEVMQTVFGVTLRLFKHAVTGHEIVRMVDESFTLPAELEHIIQLVEGLASFPVPHYSLHTAPASASASASGLLNVVIPQTLWTMYNFPPMAVMQNSGSQGVIEFEGQSFSPAFLAEYSTKVEVAITPLSNSTIVGPNFPYIPGTEADLDIQFIAAINNAPTNWFWLEPNPGWLYSYATHFAAATTVPSIASISYGWAEDAQCAVGTQECKSLKVDSQGYVNRVNVEFQKIGVRGVSLLAASGDSGANGRQDEFCTAKYLQPDYPAASPYLTSVGATMVQKPEIALKDPPALCSDGVYNCISGGDEVAVSYQAAGFTSGGGFSIYASQPSYQTAAVEAYLSSNVTLPPRSYYNATGRGYPDVAAFGDNCLVFAGVLQPVGGTSCSSPSFAAIVGLLNMLSIAKSGQPLGFINPLLYQMSAECTDCFTDITVGDNKCTESGCAKSCQGFYCAQGWDPVTGLGSPNVQNMLQYIKNL